MDIHDALEGAASRLANTAMLHVARIRDAVRVGPCVHVAPESGVRMVLIHCNLYLLKNYIRQVYLSLHVIRGR